ncbi:MAG: hypothetical protein R2684_05370 [Pyrinomonadaceae bacterium]
MRHKCLWLSVLLILLTSAIVWGQTEECRINFGKEKGFKLLGTNVDSTRDRKWKGQFAIYVKPKAVSVEHLISIVQKFRQSCRLKEGLTVEFFDRKDWTDPEDFDPEYYLSFERQKFVAVYYLDVKQGWDKLIFRKPEGPIVEFKENDYCVRFYEKVPRTEPSTLRQ